MTFVTAGLAVAGVVAVAVPIVIFLLWRQRRAPVKWGAMRFLLEAYRKHRRRLQVEQLLLLAVRCLIPLLLGLALARPLLEAAGLLEGGGTRLVYFVIDNGVASGAELAPEQTALARQAASAIAIVGGLDPGDRVGLITMARPVRAVLAPPSSDHAAVIELLESLTPSTAPSDMAGAMERVRGAMSDLEIDHPQTFVYLLSDFRAGSAALDETLPPALGPGRVTDERIALLAAPPAIEPISNVQVTRLEPTRNLILAGAVDGSGQVTVRLARQGGDLDRDVTTVRLVGGEISHVEPRVVEWMPGQTEASCEFLLDVPALSERETGLSVQVDDDALAADNDRHAVIALRQRIRVVMLDRRDFGAEVALDRMTPGQWIRRAMEPTTSGPVEVISVEPAALDEADLRGADVVFAPRPDLLIEAGWDRLRRFVNEGGLLLVSPPEGQRVHRWTDDFEDRMALRWSIAREVRDERAGLSLADEQPASSLLRMISSDLSELGHPVVTYRLLPAGAAPGTAPAALAGAQVLLRFADGTPMVLAGVPGGAGEETGTETEDAPARGLVVYLAVAPTLEWTNLPVKPLMVPLLHEVVRQGLSQIRAASAVESGGRPPLFVGPAAAGVVDPSGRRIALDGRNRPERELEQTGLYAVLDTGREEIGLVAVNVDAAAARLDPQPAGAVSAWLERAGPWRTFDPQDMGAALRRAEKGSPLAGLLLFLVLALVLTETMLARWFSHAERTATGGAARGLQATMSTPGGRGGGAR